LNSFKRFAAEELRAVLSLLGGPGVMWELAFGSWVLLQPERINAYAQAVIRTLQADEHQCGCLMEERVLKGDLAYESSMPRLEGEEERFVTLHPDDCENVNVTGIHLLNNLLVRNRPSGGASSTLQL